MLEYILEPNDLTESPNDYRAQVINVRSYNQGEIIEKMLNSRSGAGLTRSAIIAVLEAEKEVIAEIIAEGDAVNTDLFSAHFSIHGSFGPDSDAGKSNYRLNLTAAAILLAALEKVKGRKRTASPVNIINSVTDLRTGSVNGAITPGRNVKVEGQKVKIAGDETCGLFFVNTATGQRTQVDPEDIVENMPGHLLAVVPNLPPGTYHVQVVTTFNGSEGRKEPQTVTLNKPLTVQA
ncbi:MAG: DUF4469 domain-containing protein [Treponematales bacterium]